MKQIYLSITAAGCETDCIHCWANGGRHKNMAFDDIEFVVKSFKNFSGSNGYKLGFNTMHETLAHPDAISILKLRNEQNKEIPNFVLKFIPTSGIPIAIREDYKELLDGLAELEFEGFHSVLHGFGETHDKAVSCKGAFEKLKIAAERVKSAGFSYSFGVMLTKNSIFELREIKKFLSDCGIDKALGHGIALYMSGKKLRKYDEIRIEYSDIISHSDEIEELYAGPSMCKDLDGHTEAAYYKKAIEGKESFETDTDVPKDDKIHLHCDKDLNIYNGDSIVFGECYGNLKENSDMVFEKVNEGIINGRMKESLSPTLFYPNEIIPSVKELAEKYGDKNGQKIYRGGIYYKWLDKAFLKQ